MSNQPYNPVPLLALRDIIILPPMVGPLFVGREKSVRALEEAERQKKPIMLAAQRDAKTHHPGPDDIFRDVYATVPPHLLDQQRLLERGEPV